MPIYGDDRCAQCGGLRVGKSDMCADCLVKLCGIRLVRTRRLEKEKLLLEERFDRATKLIDRLLDHISREAVYTSELRLELWEAKESVSG